VVDGLFAARCRFYGGPFVLREITFCVTCSQIKEVAPACPVEELRIVESLIVPEDSSRRSPEILDIAQGLPRKRGISNASRPSGVPLYRGIFSGWTVSVCSATLLRVFSKRLVSWSGQARR